MRLSRRLAFCLWIIILMGVITIALSNQYRQVQEQREQLYTYEESLLRANAGHITQTIRQSRQFLAGISRFSGVRDCLRPSFTQAERGLACEQAKPLLKIMSDSFSPAMPLAIIDKAGKTIASSDPQFQPLIGTAILREVLQGRSASVFYPRNNEPPALIILEPVWYENTVPGAVLRLLDLHSASNHMGLRDGNYKQSLVLVDAQGTQLYAWGGFTEQPLSADWTKKILQDRKPQTQIWKGTPYVVFNQTVADNPWTLMALLPEHELEQLAATHIIPSIPSIVTAIFMLLATGFVLYWFLAELRIGNVRMHEISHDLGLEIPSKLNEVQSMLAVMQEMKQKILSQNALLKVKNDEIMDAQEKTKAFIDDLDRFSLLSVGREEKILELKKELNIIARSQGQKLPYASVENANAASQEKTLLDDMLLDFPDILDFFPLEDLQTMMSAFCQVIQVTAIISDAYGNILVQSNSGCACSRLHAQNAKIRDLCDGEFAKTLQAHHQGETLHMGSCFAGISAVSMPVIVNGDHLANLILLGFHQTPPDRTLFEKQGQQFGFDPTRYADAICDLPVINEEQISVIMNFLLQHIQTAIKLVAVQRQIQNQAEELQKKNTIFLSIAEDAETEHQIADQQHAQLEHMLSALEFEFTRTRKVLSFIFRNSNQGVLCVNNDDEVYFANRYALLMLGYSEQEIYGKHLSGIMGALPIDTTHILEQYKQDDEQYSFVTQIKNREGTALTVRIFMFVQCQNEKEITIVFEKSDI